MEYCMGGMILSNILMRTGLLKRIAYMLIEHAGNTYYKLLLSITLSGFIMNFLAPGESYIPMAMAFMVSAQRWNLENHLPLPGSC